MYQILLRRMRRDIVQVQAAGGLAQGLSFKRLCLHALPAAILIREHLTTILVLVNRREKT